MAQEDVAIRLRLLNALKFKRDAAASGKALDGVGTRAKVASKSLAAMEVASTRTNRALKSGAVFARRYAVLGLGAVGFSMGEVIRRAQASEAIMKRTNATIRSTHGVANVTAEGIERLTNTLGDYTDINYETIHQGANMVLTFTKIRNAAGKGNNIFDRTVKTVTAMTQAFHGKRSLTSTAIQVGKALQDPARGVSALRRVGVNFNTTQQQMLTHLVKTGHQLQAQKYILHELNKEFPITRGTPWNRLVTAFDRLQVILGTALIPYMDKGATTMGKLVQQFNHGVGEGGKLREALNKDAHAAGRVLHALKPVGKFLVDHQKPLEEFAAGWIGLSLALGLGKKAAGPLGKLLGKGVGGAATKFLGERGSPKNPMYVVILNGKGGPTLPGGNATKDAEKEAGKSKGLLSRIAGKGTGLAKGLGAKALALRGVLGAGGADAAGTTLLGAASTIGGMAVALGGSAYAGKKLGDAAGQQVLNLLPMLKAHERKVNPAAVRAPAGASDLVDLLAKLNTGNTGGLIEVHSHLNLDGRQVAESVHRHSVKAKALR